MGKVRIEFRVNGSARSVDTYPMARLLDVLREQIGLTGTKEGCGEGECGACSVIVNGDLVNSCLVPVLQVAGTDILTVEGLAENGHLHPVQQAFAESGGAQCGICTPGMILATCQLLKQWPNPTDQQIRDGLAGNLCRCTGYQKIFDSVRNASAALLSASPPLLDASPTLPDTNTALIPSRDHSERLF